MLLLVLLLALTLSLCDAGQSNMWLPLLNSFSRNQTLANITAKTNPKYHNIRGKFGGSATSVSQTIPWNTAYQAATTLVPTPRGGKPHCR